MMTIDTMDEICKTETYLLYLQEHIANVLVCWKEVQAKCKNMRFVYDDYVYCTLCRQIQEHDMSKLSLIEFVPYRQRFFPVDDNERAATDFQAAWEHHKKYNPHHWENWTTQTYINPYEAEINCVHMVVDWLAMARNKNNDSALTYYEKQKADIALPEWADKLVCEICEAVREKGGA